MRSATIVRRQDFTDDLFVLWLRPDAPFAFSAGQYITIGIADIERPYSIVSAPFESVIELFIERVPAEHGGALTPLLHRSRVGDTLTIRPSAKGRFTLRPTVRHHIMVATVTGIAPFVSMLRQSMHDRILGAAVDHRFFVLHGASFADEFVYDRELQQLSEAHRGVVDYVPSVSRPAASRNATWRGAVGRVNEILTDHLASWSPPPDDSVIYLCGHPEMIKDARRRVAPQGWTVAQEQYWAA